MQLIEVWIEEKLELSFIFQMPFHFLLCADVSKPPHELNSSEICHSGFLGMSINIFLLWFLFSAESVACDYPFSKLYLFLRSEKISFCVSQEANFFFFPALLRTEGFYFKNMELESSITDLTQRQQ